MKRAWLFLAIALPLKAGDFDDSVGGLVRTHCAGCHGGKSPESGLNLEGPADPADAKKWRTVLARLADGTMPPAGKPAPPADLKTKAVAALSEVTGRKPGEPRAAMRRLNRIEYQNTVRDLLGIDNELASMLPEDGRASGFDTVDAGLDLSATLMERYLEAADVALAAVFHPPPPPKEAWDKTIDVAEAARAHKEKNPTGQNLYGHARIERDCILLLNDTPIPRTVMERVPASGRYRYRISASNNALDTGGHVAMRVYRGVIGGSAGMQLVDIFPVGPEKREIEFTVALDRLEAIGLAASAVSQLYNLPADFQGPGLAIYRVEVKGPLPPEVDARAKLLAGVDPAKGTSADAARILRNFAKHAFRRPVADAEMARFVKLAEEKRKAGAGFEDSLRIGLKAILCSPEFLYLCWTTPALDDHQLAARLSYFLWSTMPDEALLEAARRKQLTTGDGLRAQVERMLADPKAAAFTEHFTGQWLNLRAIKATDPDAKLYPEFDTLLEWSMPRETRLVFDEMLKGDRPVTEFVQSDWTVLNARLAWHYGLVGVKGQEFRKVTLPAKLHRGGVLTQAAILKVTANGTTTSPVLRGAWLLERILGTPAPPPPSDIPAVEPDVRGATTIREQLAKHRSQATCASCHARIDPPGFALESFDVIGSFRDNYRVTPSAAFKAVPGAAYGIGPRVQPADKLPDGRAFQDIDGLKKLLLEDPDAIARNVAKQLIVYSTGHGIEPADRAAIEAILAATKPKNHGLRTLVHEIVRSDLFRKP